MPARSIIPEILAKLEPYLELLDRQWESQGEGCRTPTLPHDKGQVNVRAITKALGLRQSQEQHFFKKRELALAINELAKVQGLRGINSRQLQDVEDRVHTERIHKVVQHNTDLSRSLAEREAVIERQRREIEALRAQLALLEETGMAIRTSKVR
jgi:hypothetical protein